MANYQLHQFLFNVSSASRATRQTKNYTYQRRWVFAKFEVTYGKDEGKDYSIIFATYGTNLIKPTVSRLHVESYVNYIRYLPCISSIISQENSVTSRIQQLSDGLLDALRYGQIGGVPLKV